MGEDVLVVVAGIVSFEDWSNSFHPIIELEYVRPDIVIEFQYFIGFEAIDQIIMTMHNERAVQSYENTAIVRELLDLL